MNEEILENQLDEKTKSLIAEMEKKLSEKENEIIASTSLVCGIPSIRIVINNKNMVSPGDNMKFKKIIIISIVISVILLICSLLLPNINIDKDTIGYNGNDTYNIKAYNTIRDINKYIKISDNIDKKMLGNYQVTVKVRYLFYRYNKVFDIKVVDKVKPEVELKGNNPSYVCPNKDYDEEGYTASDDYDGNIRYIGAKSKNYGNLILLMMLELVFF